MIVNNLRHNLKPIAGTFQALTIGASAVLATTVTINTACTHVELQGLTSSIRERSDGSSPTATSGFIHLANAAPRVVAVEEFVKLRWIRDTGAGSDATLNIVQLSL